MFQSFFAKIFWGAVDGLLLPLARVEHGLPLRQ